MTVNYVTQSCPSSALSAGISKLITSSKPFYPPRYLRSYTSDSAYADIVRVYKFHLLDTNSNLFLYASSTTVLALGHDLSPRNSPGDEKPERDIGMR